MSDDAHIAFTVNIGLTFWQRVKHVFRGHIQGEVLIKVRSSEPVDIDWLVVGWK